MSTLLVATASVHTTAAACDYLETRLGTDDTVVVVGIRESGLAERDLSDAANVARTRLVAPAVETLTRAGEPAETIAAVAEECGADAIVVGATRGDPEHGGNPPGSTVKTLIAEARRPVTVLPAPAP